MKNTLKILFLLLYSITLQAQNVNWRKQSDDSTKHSVTINLGLKNSIYYGFGYTYKLHKFKIPIAFSGEWNLPVGKDVLDDWTQNLKVQTKLTEYKKFIIGTQIGYFNQRYNSEIATFFSTGMNLGLISGIEFKKWGLASEFNFDKYLGIHIRNNNPLLNFPMNGWYKNSSGLFEIGLRTNFSINKSDIFLHIGKLYSQDLENNPILPYYLKIVFQKRF